jgi:hypothetical protein
MENENEGENENNSSNENDDTSEIKDVENIDNTEGDGEEGGDFENKNDDASHDGSNDDNNSSNTIDSFDKHIDSKEHHVPYNPKSTAHKRHHAILKKQNERLKQEAKEQFDTNEDLVTGKPKVPEPHLPVSNFFWLLLIATTLYFENVCIIVAVTLISWSGLSQCSEMESYMYTDYRPDSLIVTDPIDFQQQTIDHICFNVGCNPIDLNSSLFNVKNVTYTRIGTVLTTGIMRVDITWGNPREWGWVALSTQMEMMMELCLNPLSEMYSKSETLFTPAATSINTTLLSCEKEDYPPQFTWLFVVAAFLGVTTISNLLIVCCIDPEINIDSASVQAFEDNRNEKIANETKLAKKARAVGLIKDAQEHEVTIGALKMMKMPRMKCCPRFFRYSLVCFKCEIFLWTYASIKKGRESFIILLFKLSSTIFQSLPCMTMLLYLGFAQPRRFSLIMLFSICLSTVSAAITMCLWEKNQMKAETDETIRLCSIPAFWMFFGRLIEVIVRAMTIALFGATYGTIGMAILVGFDYFVMHILVMLTWYQSSKKFAAKKSGACGAIGRAVFIAPTLIYLYHDHYMGRVENNSFVRPNLYWGWRAIELSIILPMILARAPIEDEKVNDLSYTNTISTAILIIMTGVMYMYTLPNMYKQLQRMRRIPRTGINFPVPEKWRNLEAGKLGQKVKQKDTSMDKNSANLLSHYGAKLYQMDEDAEKREEQKMAELQRQMMKDGGGFDNDVEYKQRVMELARLQEEKRKSKANSHGYLFQGVDIDKKLKDAEEEMERAEKMLKEHEEIAAEVDF